MNKVSNLKAPTFPKNYSSESLKYTAITDGTYVVTVGQTKVTVKLKANVAYTVTEMLQMAKDQNSI